MGEREQELLRRLRRRAEALRAQGLRDLACGPGSAARATDLIRVVDGWFFDLSKRLWDGETLADLHALAEARGVFDRFTDQLAGAQVNGTEMRAALHTAWRREDGPHTQETRAASAAHARFVDDARARFDAIVSIGIGGSDLGPRFVVDALTPEVDGALTTRFCSNVDPAAFERAVHGLDPAKTLVVVVSKSFSTQETLSNARRAKAWLEAAGVDVGDHFAAATARPDRARDFGVDAAAIFAFEDWVGGRFSLWSAAGLAIPLALGNAAMTELRAGAAEADASAATARDGRDPAFQLAALDWWSRVMLGAPGRVIAPYAEALGRLPAWLSQVEMESLGKSVMADGAALDEPSVGAVWGAAGTDAQHAFFQSLHQGAAWPVEFVGVRSKASEGEGGRALIANMIAQGEALLIGKDEETASAQALAAGGDAQTATRLAPHKAFPGGRESATIIMADLSPRALGRLLATYEHKTAFLGYLMGINPFDQMGVELGKELAGSAAAALDGAGAANRDPSTRALIAWFS